MIDDRIAIIILNFKLKCSCVYNSVKRWKVAIFKWLTTYVYLKPRVQIFALLPFCYMLVYTYLVDIFGLNICECKFFFFILDFIISVCDCVFEWIMNVKWCTMFCFNYVFIILNLSNYLYYYLIFYVLSCFYLNKSLNLYICIFQTTLNM